MCGDAVLHRVKPNVTKVSSFRFPFAGRHAVPGAPPHWIVPNRGGLSRGSAGLGRMVAGGGAASKLGVPSFEFLLALPSLPLLATISARTLLEPPALSVALLKDDMSVDDTAVTRERSATPTLHGSAR
jgi:hypothetical protein